MSMTDDSTFRGDAIYMRVVWVLFALFFVMTAGYLHRVPGLLGDEGSEGENVYEIFDRGISAVGERSYIGPFIDYVRIPFVIVFGYSTLALRFPVLLISLASFWLAERMLRRMFGRRVALYALTAFLFSPIYLLYQRLGWAITLSPFFALLLVNLLLSTLRYKWILIGLTAGIGLANHILFLPTLIGILTASMFWVFLGGRDMWRTALRSVWVIGGNAVYAFVGFWAGFGMQAAVLLMMKEDQGDPDAVAALFSERVDAFLEYWQLYVSGSSYIARYIGEELSLVHMGVVSWTVVVLMILGVVLLGKKRQLWAWVIGLSVHTGVLLYMIDRFTLRYFVVLVLIVWCLAGVGLGALIEKIGTSRNLQYIGSVLLALGLSVWMVIAVAVPFLRTGGSVNDFSLGDRTNSAAAFVDVRPLISCLRGIGPIHSENVHIWNRLQYLSHQYEDLEVLSDEESGQAQWIVHMREEGVPGGTKSGDICPELEHFKVVSASGG